MGLLGIQKLSFVGQIIKQVRHSKMKICARSHPMTSSRSQKKSCDSCHNLTWIQKWTEYVERTTWKKEEGYLMVSGHCWKRCHQPGQTCCVSSLNSRVLWCAVFPIESEYCHWQQMTDSVIDRVARNSVKPAAYTYTLGEKEMLHCTLFVTTFLAFFLQVYKLVTYSMLSSLRSLVTLFIQRILFLNLQQFYCKWKFYVVYRCS